MEDKKRAWVYCHIDAPEDTHGTLKGQRKQLFDYAEQMGVIVVGSSEDLSSGLDFDRPGLKRVTEAAQAGTMDVLLIHNIARICRDTCRTMEYLERLRQNGITVYSPLEGMLDFSFQRFVGACSQNADMRRL